MAKIEVEIPDSIWKVLDALTTILKITPEQYIIRIIQTDLNSTVEEIITLS